MTQNATTFQVRGELEFGVSRDTEIAAIKTIRAHVADGTFIASLLSPAMIQALEWKITNDWSTDIYADYAAQLRETQTANGNAEIYKQRAIDAENKLVDVRNETSATIELTFKNATDSILAANDRADRAIANAESLRVSYEEMTERMNALQDVVNRVTAIAKDALWTSSAIDTEKVRAALMGF